MLSLIGDGPQVVNSTNTHSLHSTGVPSNQSGALEVTFTSSVTFVIEPIPPAPIGEGLGKLIFRLFDNSCSLVAKVVRAAQSILPDPNSLFNIQGASAERPQEDMCPREEQRLITDICQRQPVEGLFEIEMEFGLQEADEETLVIYDVDDVLITYEDMVLRPCGEQFRPSSWDDIDPVEIRDLLSIMLSESRVILTDS